ncbi:radical SAM protein [bacterium]|nr:radical SAM protein [bacterium]
MKIIAKRGNPDIATVFLADFGGRYVEFVESRQPPLSFEEKLVFIISVSFGCPIRCAFCDAGGNFSGHLSAEQMVEQVDFLVRRRFKNEKIPVKKFKIQFARMGEPALNEKVIDAMKILSSKIDAKGLMFCVSTVAPVGRENFFEQIAQIKDDFDGRFQLQFSIHSTDANERDFFIPVKKWTLEQIAEYGNSFWKDSDRKITLNFAVAEGSKIEVEKIADIFSPEKFLIKITPINPTERAKTTGVKSAFRKEPSDRIKLLLKELSEKNFDVILSVGELEENFIGSNCGQLVAKFTDKSRQIVERNYGAKYSYIDKEVEI